MCLRKLRTVSVNSVGIGGCNEQEIMLRSYGIRKKDGLSFK